MLSTQNCNKFSIRLLLRNKTIRARGNVVGLIDARNSAAYLVISVTRGAIVLTSYTTRADVGHVTRVIMTSIICPRD